MDIIKSSTDISDLFLRGRRIYTPHITLIVASRKYGRMENSNGRVAFIAGKKNGNAVWRNAAKRRMREICRQQQLDKKERDIIFLAKKDILNYSFLEIYTDIESAAKRI